MLGNWSNISFQNVSFRSSPSFEKKKSDVQTLRKRRLHLPRPLRGAAVLVEANARDLESALVTIKKNQDFWPTPQRPIPKPGSEGDPEFYSTADRQY